MNRRLFLQILGAGAAVPAAAAAAPRAVPPPHSYSWPFPEYPPTPAGTGNPVPFWEGGLEGVETQSGHAIMSFPRDHRYHYGPIYHGPEISQASQRFVRASYGWSKSGHRGGSRRAASAFPL